MKITRYFLTLVLLLTVFQVASLADTFTFSGRGTGDNGDSVVFSGSGNANPNGPGQGLATDLSGTAIVSGNTNATFSLSMMPGGPGVAQSHHWAWDNLVYDGDPHLDIYGLGLMVGAHEGNLWFEVDEYGFGISDLGSLGPKGLRNEIFTLTEFQMDVQPTPEPGSLILLGSGLLGLGGAIRRKMVS